MEYNYTNITTEPNSAQIHADITASTMTDKAIEGCTWHEDDAKLHLHFTNSLSAAL